MRVIPLVEYSFDRDDFMDRDPRGLFDRPSVRLSERDRAEERAAFERDLARERAEDQRALDAAARAKLEEALIPMTVEALRQAVNDPGVRVTPSGAIVKKTRSSRFGGQSNQFVGQGFDLPVKKPRKKNKKHCKNLSMCLRQANAEMRKKNGSLRKGKTQADVMRRAHKLMKKC